MATHPHKPANPDKPVKSRHVVAKAHSVKHDARGAQEIMERDAIRVLEWLGAAPLRTITSESMRSWVKRQDPPWTPGYWQAIRAMAMSQLSERTRESGMDTRAKLLNMIERLIPACTSFVTGTGPSSPGLGSEGTIFLKHPETKEPLTKIEHQAVVKYLQLYADLTGLTAEKHQHLHLHKALEKGDLSEVPESELIAASAFTVSTTNQE